MRSGRDDKKNQKNDEQDSRDLGGQGGKTAKSQNTGDQCEHQKCQGPVKHGYPPCLTAASFAGSTTGPGTAQICPRALPQML
jgi:hypothetical protein